MATNTKHPSLSRDGYTDNPQQVADNMLAHFYLSERSQTFFFSGKVSSFPDLLQMYKNDPIKLAAEAQSVLTRYFSTQFETVTVECSAVEDPDNKSQMVLVVYAVMFDKDGNEINLSRNLQENSPIMNTFIKENNGV